MSFTHPCKNWPKKRMEKQYKYFSILKQNITSKQFQPFQHNSIILTSESIYRQDLVTLKKYFFILHHDKFEKKNDILRHYSRDVCIDL